MPVVPWQEAQYFTKVFSPEAISGCLGPGFLSRSSWERTTFVRVTSIAPRNISLSNLMGTFRFQRRSCVSHSIICRWLDRRGPRNQRTYSALEHFNADPLLLTSGLKTRILDVTLNNLPPSLCPLPNPTRCYRVITQWDKRPRCMQLWLSIAFHHSRCKLLILRVARLRRQTLYPAELWARCLASRSISVRLQRYFPTTSTTKDPGFILPRRWPGAGGSKSAAGRKIL